MAITALNFCNPLILKIARELPIRQDKDAQAWMKAQVSDLLQIKRKEEDGEMKENVKVLGKRCAEMLFRSSLFRYRTTQGWTINKYQDWSFWILFEGHH